MAVSDLIDNTVKALVSRFDADQLTKEEFVLGMRVFADCAEQVRELENNVVPPAARLTADQLADGKVVPLRKTS